MYQFKDKLDHTGFILFNKRWIEAKNWACLPLASQAIIPIVLYFRNNETGEAFPSQETISILSGQTEKTVRKGIEGLKSFPGIKVVPYITRHGKRSKKFKIDAVQYIKGQTFTIKNIIFEGGNWHKLTQAGQSLYPVMRHFGHFSKEMYLHAEDRGDEYEESDFDELYRWREWEFCDADIDVLAEYSNIHQRSVYNALNSLEECYLVERYQDEYFKGWKVFLDPPQIYKREYLNTRVLSRMKKRVPVEDIPF